MLLWITPVRVEHKPLHRWQRNVSYVIKYFRPKETGAGIFISAPIFVKEPTDGIENGKPILDHPEAFQRLKESLEGCEIEITLQKRQRAQDVGQLRRYFHGVVLPKISTAAGYGSTVQEREIVKQGLKERFLTVPAPPGAPVEVRSTESLTKGEYSLFIDHCRRYAAETFGISIEDPS
jgi:hypothetical protein